MDCLDQEKTFRDLRSAKKNTDEYKHSKVAEKRKSATYLGDLVVPQIFRGRWQRKIDIPYFPIWGYLMKNKLIYSFERAREKNKKILFVSHQWLSTDHPDPGGVQLRALYGSLRRLLAQKKHFIATDSMLSCWYDIMGGGKRRDRGERMTSREWKEFMQNALLWIDFQSIPQAQDDPKLWNIHNSGDCEEEEDSLPSSKETDVAMSDLVMAAVKSMPAFVKKSDLFVILAPTTKPDDQGKYYGYQTWLTRGWCIFERFCAAMSEKCLPVVLISSPNISPVYMEPYMDFRLRVGFSNFMCCDRKQCEGNSTCDRKKVFSVMQYMIKDRVHRLFLGKNRNVLNARILLMLSNHYFDGMRSAENNDDKTTPVVSAVASSFSSPFEMEAKEKVNTDPPENVESLKGALLWRDGLDDQMGQKTGWTLLKFAILGRYTKIVRDILQKRPYAPEPVIFGRIMLTKMTNLHISLMAHDGNELVNLLLSHGAGLAGTSSIEGNSFIRLIFLLQNVPTKALRNWLSNRRITGGFDPRRRDIFGMSVLHACAAFNGRNTSSVIRMLTEAGVSLDSVAMNGTNVFHWLMFNIHVSCEDLEDIVDLYRQKYGKTNLRLALNNCCPIGELEWRGKLLRYSFAYINRWLYRSGAYRHSRKEKFIQWNAVTCAAPPLVYGLHMDQTEKLLFLMKVGADPLLKNALGMTAATACVAFGCSKETFQKLKASEEARARSLALRGA